MTVQIRGSLKVATGVLALSLVGVGACAPRVKRDLSSIPVGQVGFDDMCALQSYFDDIEANKETVPTLISSTEFEGTKKEHMLRSGRTRFAFQGRAQLAALRRVLDENWARLPPAFLTAPRLDLDVYWSERDGLRRVVSNRDAYLILGSLSDETVDLPYHVCLSELLYGAPLYHQRRDIMGLPPIVPVADAAVAATTDGGVPSPASADAGTRTDSSVSDAGAPRATPSAPPSTPAAAAPPAAQPTAEPMPAAAPARKTTAH